MTAARLRPVVARLGDRATLRVFDDADQYFTFMNEIADLCEQVGADVQEIARGIGPGTNAKLGAHRRGLEIDRRSPGW